MSQSEPIKPQVGQIVEHEGQRFWCEDPPSEFEPPVQDWLKSFGLPVMEWQRDILLHSAIRRPIPLVVTI